MLTGAALLAEAGPESPSGVVSAVADGAAAAVAESADGAAGCSWAQANAGAKASDQAIAAIALEAIGSV